MARSALGRLARLVTSTSLLIGTLLGPVSPRIEVMAASAPTAPTIPAKLECAALSQNGTTGPGDPAQPGVPDFSQVPDFPTRITSVTLVAAKDQEPELCDVLGYIQPQIHFELKLPTTTWQ